ncbi:UNVERIFIED_CONTAM: hypothetical protein K2H54_074458 [Gekko kuhli]
MKIMTRGLLFFPDLLLAESGWVGCDGERKGEASAREVGVGKLSKSPVRCLVRDSASFHAARAFPSRGRLAKA